MSCYMINDQSLIEELCGDIAKTAAERLAVLKETFAADGRELPEPFEYPLDDEIVGRGGDLEALLSGGEKTITYAKAEKLDKLWRRLLEKSIKCLRYFDTREPFMDCPGKAIVAYGIDTLEEYHKRYTEFEGLMYGSSAYYRDHVFHAVRVWMLGVFCLLNRPQGENGGEPGEAFISGMGLDSGAEPPGEIHYFEYISMWTIIALCHDLGYPLEKAEQILDKTRKMMQEFIPNPNIWNNFGYSGIQDNINDYILRFISTKMTDSRTADGEEAEKEYWGRIQPKYYLKYAKSLEKFRHGVISAIIIYKMLLYFLESNFNLNDDYTYTKEDARQFYIRREILRAIAAHTCPDTYNIHITTFPSLLFLCDELQEWGRRTWNELYTGLKEDSISLEIHKFSRDEVAVREIVQFEQDVDEAVTDNICRVFERQYSLYKTTFRDGQDTSKRNFSLEKRMEFKLPNKAAKTKRILIEYCLPKSDPGYFKVNLSDFGEQKHRFEQKIREKLAKKLYYKDLTFS